MISIITPTYNREHLLPRMINSVLNQTYPDWELLIMDDGSEDETEMMVNSFGDSRIKYFFGQNSGAGDKRNKGVKKARGEYIIFLDSDDEVKETWLETMTEPLNGRNNIIVTCGWEKYDFSGTLVESGAPQDLGKMFNNLILNFLSGCMLYTKHSFINAGGYDIELQSGQHTELLIRLISVWEEEGYTIETCYEPLVKIHLHKGERIRHNHLGLYQGTKRILEKHTQLFLKNPDVHHNYLSVVAVNALRTGRISEGKDFLYKAIKIKPWAVKNVLRLMIVSVPFLGSKFWKNKI